MSIWHDGAITASLGLNIGGFTNPLFQAEEEAKVFNGVIGEFIASPLIGLAGLAREVGSDLTEMFNSIQERSEDMGLLAERANMDVQAFSELAGVASFVKVNADQLAQSMQFMQRSTSEFANGVAGKELIEAFREIGISSSFVKEHINDTALLFETVRNGISSLPRGEQENVLQEIFSRGGGELIPMIRMTRDEVDKLVQSEVNFGAVTTKSMADSAHSFELTKNDWNNMVAGIENDAMGYVMGVFRDHAEQIQGIMQNLSKEVRGEIDNVFKYLDSPEGRAVIAEYKADVQWFVNHLPDVENGVKQIGAVLTATAQDAALVVDTITKLYDLAAKGHMNTGGPEIEQRNQLEMSDADRQYIHAKTGVMPPPGVTYGDEFASLKEAGVAGADSFPMFAQPADGRINPFLMLNRGSNGEGNDLGAAFDALLAKESGPNGRPSAQAVNQFMIQSFNVHFDASAYQSEASLAQAMAAAITKAKAMASDGHYVETGIGAH